VALEGAQRASNVKNPTLSPQHQLHNLKPISEGADLATAMRPALTRPLAATKRALLTRYARATRARRSPRSGSGLGWLPPPCAPP